MFLKEKIFIGITIFATIPWILSFLLSIHYPPHLEALIAGTAVVSAAFILSWAAETAEKDLPRSLSLAVVALLAVLPEYAVDIYFTWMAGKVGGEYVHYAAANMTGANRLLLGIGWSTVAIFAITRIRKREIVLDEGIRLEFFVLLVASLYCFLIPLKGNISLIDTGVLLAIYILYLYTATKAHREEFEPHGVPAYLCCFPTRRRRASVIFLFIFSAFVILISVESFAEGLIGTAKKFEIDEFLMVQWIAPLASESPEFIVAIYFIKRFRTTASFNTLVSSKVNQWTLLVGCLALIYSISLGHPNSLPLDERQKEEFLLTAAQSLLGVAIIINLRFNLFEALLLLALFMAQFFYQSVEMRYILSFAYLIIAVPPLIAHRSEIVKSYIYVIKLLNRR
ncbi:MAG: sodium:calcium antiporter [Archaeoglobaceae archaeon]|nr:sodium:calcium antiporter [Archaeoglobaceae archaeon]MDW7989052.1 sodium:calcium antiporter [Archaeoglobaceae archaeon]